MQIFKDNHRHVCHTTFAVFFSLPSFCVVLGARDIMEAKAEDQLKKRDTRRCILGCHIDQIEIMYCMNY